MKFFYIANIRLPTERAHGIQIMEMCAAFAEQGCSVELVVPNRRNHLKEDPFVYHDVPRTFALRTLPSLDLVRFGRLGFLISLLSFTASTLWYAFFQKDALFYTRDEVIALVLHLSGKRVVWEGHDGQRNVIARMIVYLKIPMVVTMTALKDLYLSFGANAQNILVASNGADINRFNISLLQEEARKELNLSLNKIIVLYKGHLYERKGAHTVARAAPLLKERGVECVFIGGNELDVEAFKKEFGAYENVKILGNKPRRETPIYQKAADFLVIPNSAKDDISNLYTSPMKLFGYMASGVPIIASDLPPLREILNDSLAYFFTPDSPESFAKVLTQALGSREVAKKKGEATLALASEYSWQKRAEHILAFIHTHSNL